jgi:hypothetical protein
MDPTDQGQDGAETPIEQQAEAPEAAPPQGQAGQPGAPLKGRKQKRINELTAQRYAVEKQLAEAREQMTQMASQMAEMGSRFSREREPAPPPEPQAPPPPEGVDPGVADYFSRLVTHAVGKIEQRVNQSLTQISSSIAGSEAHSHAKKLAGIMGDKEGWIVQRAEQLARAGRQNGLPLPPSDYARFAAGEYAEKRAASPRNGDGRYSAPISPNGVNGPGQSVIDPRQQARDPLPADFDQLSPKKQMKLLQERGIEDQPL